jgi:hypothetical protein
VNRWSLALRMAVLVAAAGVSGWMYFHRNDLRHDVRASRDQTVSVDIGARPSPAPRLARVRPRLDAGLAAEAPALDEGTLMHELRALVKDDPRKAESLARVARERFGDSPSADERDALLVDALINQQKIGAARSETYYYVDHHPNGRFAEHLFAMTGVHPPPKRTP